MGNEISEVINILCEKLGTTGQYLVPELAKINIAECIIWGIISLITVIVSIYFLPKVWKYDNNKEYSFWIIIPIMLIIVFSLVFMIALTDAVGWIISPTAKTISYFVNSMTTIE